MNAPLIDSAPLNSLGVLNMALLAGRSNTGDIRSAMARCRVSEDSPIEERLAVAAAHIVCTPGELQRGYADHIRGDLLAMTGNDRALACLYSDIAITAMSVIVAHLGNMAHEEKLRMEYDFAIKAEKVLLRELIRERVSASA